MQDALPVRRARPVADAPVVDPRELTKAWLLELVAARPLEEVGRLPADALAREAPALCGALTAALRSDDALARLAPDGDLAPLAARTGALAGADDAASAVAAVEVLRAVTWTALAERLSRAEPGHVADLADRLGAVVAVLVTAVVASPEGDRRSASAAGGRGPVAVPDPVDVAARDVRRPAPPAVPGWRAAIERRVDEHRADGRPFAVLVAEVDDADRLLGADEEGRVARVLDDAERAACAEARPADAVVRERPGRWWLVAGDTAPAAARALAERVAGAVADLPPLHGVALRATVGVATCPADGTDAGELEARADERRWAARAAGVRVAD